MGSTGYLGQVKTARLIAVIRCGFRSLNPVRNFQILIT